MSAPRGARACALTLTPARRVTALESVHEEALQTLGGKLGEVGAYLADRSNAESAMHNIAGKVALLESKLASHSVLAERMSRLESQLLAPDPDHDRIITRINAKLDTIEAARRPSSNLRAEGSDELRFFQDRVAKLTALRSKYASEEREMMG